VALFSSVLRDLSLRALQKRDGRPAGGGGASAEHVALLDDLSGTFVARYESSAQRPVSRARIDLWHALLTFDRVVLCWTKNRFERLPHCMALLTHLYGSDDLTQLVA
jgi:hypothetical protein